MNTYDPIKEEAKLVIDMYDYALAHNLNIEDRSAVITIMKALNQEDVSDERIERLMKALQITAQRIQSKSLCGRQ
jgi:truncated hemoglobin YjbI